MSSAAQPQVPPAAAPTAAAPAALSSSPTADVVTEPSSPPPHAQPDPVQQSQPHSTLQRPRDPKVAQLKALFPDLEDSVLEAVLDGTAGSLDEATEQLLMMSDPDFKTDTTQLSQLEADEELARQLAREDELEQAQQRINAPHRSARSSTGHQQAPSQPRPLAYRPYVSRRNTGGGGGPASPSLSSWEPPMEQSSVPRQEQGQQRDELQELTEQFNKVADTGKRMFGSFLSKAKEQMNRLDDAIVRSASPPSTSTPSTSAPAPAPPPKPAHPAPARTSSTSSWTAPSPLPRPPPPRNLSSDGPPPVVMIDRTGLAGGGAGGDEKKDEPTAAAAASALVGAGGLAAPGSAASTDSPKKDFSSKIPGLLPRQSFSLLDAKAGPKSPSAEDKGAPTSTSTSASTQGAAGSGATPAAAGLAAGAGAGAGAALGAGGAPMASPLSAPNHALGDDDDESDDDLEYTRSPFDDD